jgi:hypothetical protein
VEPITAADASVVAPKPPFNRSRLFIDHSFPCKPSAC